LRLVQQIWHSLVDEDPPAVGVSKSHRARIDKRLAEHRAAPDDVLTHAQLKRSVRAHLARR
jgi:putative addiction module component (TIGR02574 family)